MLVKKQQLEPCMEQLAGSGLRKEDDRSVCGHPVCLTYTLSTWGMSDWMSYKPESSLTGETTVIIRHGTSDWFKIGKGVPQGCILSPSLFNLHAECIM